VHARFVAETNMTIRSQWIELVGYLESNSHSSSDENEHVHIHSG